MNKELYFKELGIVLSRSGFTVQTEQDGFLPVEYEGRPLCRVDATGSVFYHQDNVNTLDREAACRRVTDSATIVQEYMTLPGQRCSGETPRRHQGFHCNCGYRPHGRRKTAILS